MALEPTSSARLLVALGAIERAAAKNAERSLEIQRRVRWLRQQLDTGQPLVDLIENEESPVSCRAHHVEHGLAGNRGL